jgi:CspA family cold shock protein
MANGQQQGSVKFFDSKKGFGFITPDDGTRDVFISANNVPKEGSLMPDTRVGYKLEDGAKGPYATNIVLL